MDSELYDDRDRLIDAALGDYTSAEPMNGLERRVIARVQLRESRRRWGIAIVSAAAAISVVWVASEMRRATIYQPTTIVSRPEVATVVPATVPAPIPDVPTRSVSRRVRRSLTLTEGERALARLAWERPEQATALFRETPESEVKAIEIETISITPIEISALE